MDKMDVLLWVMGGGFGIMFAILLVVYQEIRSGRKEQREDSHEARQNMADLRKDVASIDKRLYGIETVLHMKECCVLKNDQNLKKAE